MVALIAYYLADRHPASYSPVDLTESQGNEVALDFINRKLINDFGNRAQEEEPFEWVISQEQANLALASMDQIGYQLGSPRHAAKAVLNQLGIEDPAVQFEDGQMTLMAFHRQYRKVLGTKLSVTTADGQLSMKVKSISVGSLPLPTAVVLKSLTSYKEALMAAPAPASKPSIRSAGIISSNDLAAVLQVCLIALDGQPVKAQVVWPLNKKAMTIQDIQFTQGKLTIKLTPAPEAGKPASSGGSRTPSPPAKGQDSRARQH